MVVLVVGGGGGGERAARRACHSRRPATTSGRLRQSACTQLAVRFGAPAVDDIVVGEHQVMRFTFGYFLYALAERQINSVHMYVARIEPHLIHERMRIVDLVHVIVRHVIVGRPKSHFRRQINAMFLVTLVLVEASTGLFVLLMQTRKQLVGDAQQLECARPTIGVESYHLLECVFECRRNFSLHGLVLNASYAEHQLGQAVSCKERLGRDQFVQDTAERPNIGLEVCWPTQAAFGRAIGERAQVRVGEMLEPHVALHVAPCVARGALLLLLVLIGRV